MGAEVKSGFFIGLGVAAALLVLGLAARMIGG